jgi:tetratricopeptide (TPR) repeat protein
MAFHQGWVHGYWRGHYPGGLGWRPAGHGDRDFRGEGPSTGLGLGLGWGFSPWLFGPMIYNYGYLSYDNPYSSAVKGGRAVVAQRPGIHDDSQPVDARSAPPEQSMIDRAVSALDRGRGAFKAGDYSRALGLVDEALESTPDDPTLHELRALALFALKRYDEAAPVLYGVLSVRPGWDWTTLISLYSDPERYTQQLRALEAFTTQRLNRAAAHFVLAYHYLTTEHADAAVRQLKTVTVLQPKDMLSAQLIQQLERPQHQVVAAGLAQPESSTSSSAVRMVAAGTQAKIDGTWTAQPNVEVRITVTLHAEGRFTWKVSRQGKDQQFEGKSRYENGMLTLVQDQNNDTMVGNVHWTEDTRFNFKLMGAGAGDPGLTFTRTS